VPRSEVGWAHPMNRALVVIDIHVKGHYSKAEKCTCGKHRKCKKNNNKKKNKLTGDIKQA